MFKNITIEIHNLEPGINTHKLKLSYFALIQI